MSSRPTAPRSGSGRAARAISKKRPRSRSLALARKNARSGSRVALTMPITHDAVSRSAVGSSNGPARSAMREPTGAIASTVRAPANAITTVFVGTLCAPMAPRTICSTVEIFTNAVSVMNANGSSVASPMARISVIGRARRSAGAAP
jgi:hypothetical protein